MRENADRSFSADEIAEGLKGEVSISAVYRNIDALEKQGAVMRVVKQENRKAFYRSSMLKECKNHLHISCTKCGKTFHVENKVSGDVIDSVKRATDFDIDPNATMFFGVCKNCKERARK